MSNLKDLLAPFPVLPEVAAGEEAGDGVTGQVMDPALLPQLPFNLSLFSSHDINFCHAKTAKTLPHLVFCLADALIICQENFISSRQLFDLAPSLIAGLAPRAFHGRPLLVRHSGLPDGRRAGRRPLQAFHQARLRPMPLA